MDLIVIAKLIVEVLQGVYYMNLEDTCSTGDFIYVNAITAVAK